MKEAINKINDEEIEIVTNFVVKKKIKKSELLAQKEKTEELLSHFN